MLERQKIDTSGVEILILVRGLGKEARDLGNIRVLGCSCWIPN